MVVEPLQLLIVEDNQDDADLLLHELRRGSFNPKWSCVQTETDFLSSLEKQPEIILCDYSMPEFSGLRALELLQSNGLDIPFILISGTVGEDVAVKAMRDGAADYLLKDRLARLPEAVKRALAQKKARAERNQANLERERLVVDLQAALSEKTVLLKEVHHRVKNNMAVIVGILGMQADALDNEKALIAFETCQRRVSSMGLIQEYLYATEQLDRVNFGQYVHQLANQLFVAYAIRPDLVSLDVEAEEIDLPVHRAIPCGLILNELISNALKHAFPRGRKGKIRVRYGRVDSGELALSCRDDGVGFPESVEWKNSRSVGLQIVTILTKQIHGELVLERSGGWQGFELRFPSRQL